MKLVKKLTLFIILIIVFMTSCNNKELTKEMLKYKNENTKLLDQLDKLKNENENLTKKLDEMNKNYIDLRNKLNERDYLGVFKPVKVKEINIGNSNFEDWLSIPNRITLKVEKINNEYIYSAIDFTDKMVKIKKSNELVDKIISFNDIGFGDRNITYEKGKKGFTAHIEFWQEIYDSQNEEIIEKYEYEVIVELEK